MDQLEKLLFIERVKETYTLDDTVIGTISGVVTEKEFEDLQKQLQCLSAVVAELLRKDRDWALQQVDYTERKLEMEPRTAMMRKWIKEKGLEETVAKWQRLQDMEV